MIFDFVERNKKTMLIYRVYNVIRFTWQYNSTGHISEFSLILHDIVTYICIENASIRVHMTLSRKGGRVIEASL